MTLENGQSILALLQALDCRADALADALQAVLQTINVFGRIEIGRHVNDLGSEAQGLGPPIHFFTGPLVAGQQVLLQMTHVTQFAQRGLHQVDEVHDPQFGQHRGGPRNILLFHLEVNEDHGNGSKHGFVRRLSRASTAAPGRPQALTANRSSW